MAPRQVHERPTHYDHKLSKKHVIGKARRKKKKYPDSALPEQKRINPPRRRDYAPAAYKPRQYIPPNVARSRKELGYDLSPKHSSSYQPDTSPPSVTSQDTRDPSSDEPKNFVVDDLVIIPSEIFSVSLPRNPKIRHLSEAQLVAESKCLLSLSVDLCSRLTAVRSDAISLYEIHHRLMHRVHSLRSSELDARLLRASGVLQYVSSAEDQINECTILREHISKLRIAWETAIAEEGADTDLESEYLGNDWKAIAPGELFSLYRAILKDFTVELEADELQGRLDVPELSDTLENAVSAETGGDERKYHFLAAQIAQIITKATGRDADRMLTAAVLMFVRTEDASHLIQLCE